MMVREFEDGGDVCISRNAGTETIPNLGSGALIFLLPLHAPGGSVRGERANLTRLVLGCIDADFCK